MNSDVRKFIASCFLVSVLIALVGYLTYIVVPPENKELIVTILGVLLGAGSAAIPNLVGDPKTETKELRAKVDELDSDLRKVRAQYAEVKTAYDTIVQMLIERHVVLADGIQSKDEA